jgi:hypothetical protein
MIWEQHRKYDAKKLIFSEKKCRNYDADYDKSNRQLGTPKSISYP